MEQISLILQEWTNLTVLGGALIFGYILNNYISMENKHIPLIMAITGVFISLALNGYVDFETTILSGALNGLASTGFHQLFHQYIKAEQKDTFEQGGDKNGKN